MQKLTVDSEHKIEGLLPTVARSEELMRASEEFGKEHDDSILVPIAFAYCSLGNKDRAFDWLDKAVERRSWMIVYLKYDNVSDPLRADPKFKDLLRNCQPPMPSLLPSMAPRSHSLSTSLIWSRTLWPVTTWLLFSGS